MSDITAEELAATLRRLERRGIIESFLDDDGEVHWRTTGKEYFPNDDEPQGTGLS